MARYVLTTAGRQFVQGGNFSFRVAYSFDDNGAVRVVQSKRAPTITIDQNDIIETTNAWAISAIEQMTVPERTVRGGNRKTSGLMFQTTPSAGPSIDLDAIFAAAQAS